MKPVTRRAALRRALLLTLAVACGYQAPPVSGSETEGQRPDFSGVWLPNSKESGRWPAQPPFTPAMAAARASWAETYTPIDLTRDDEHISCVPYTLPYIMTTITQYPFEIVSTPSRILLLTEVYGQVRRIHLDGAEPGDLLPSRTGFSRGRWEGSQLVVETTHILPLHEGNRYPTSPALRMVERFSLQEGGPTGKQLINEITFHDPAVYGEPVVVRMAYKWARDVEVGEYICEQDVWDQHLDGNVSKIPWR